jgi:hypothetical protein
MTRRTLIGLAILLLAVSGCGRGKPKEAVYKGKTISQWVADIKGPDLEAKRAALVVVTEMPPRDAAPAIPAAVALGADPDPLTRCRAAMALAHITTEIRIPLPIASLRTPDLVKLLKDEHPEVRRAAAEALGKFGPAVNKQLAVPALNEALKDADAQTRKAAEAALARIGPAEAEEGAKGDARAGEPGPNPWRPGAKKVPPPGEEEPPAEKKDGTEAKPPESAPETLSAPERRPAGKPTGDR